MKRILSYMGAALILVGLVSPVSNVPPAPVAYAEQMSHVSDVKEELQEVAEPVSEPVAPLPEPEPTPVAPAPVQVQDVNANEAIIWNYLRNQGFTANQTAGIMGNLQQEHGFKTSDMPGGMGIAQWIGNRRANLLAMPAPETLDTQLAFLMRELKGTESAAYSAIVASNSVDEATRAFQNNFERCGICMEGQRISYAYSILGRH